MWDAIEDTPAQAENMKLRSTLIMTLKGHIARTGLSHSDAAKPLGVTQPRICDLMRGKIELLGLDTLVNMIGLQACMLKCASRMQPDQKPLADGRVQHLVQHGSSKPTLIADCSSLFEMSLSNPSSAPRTSARH